MKIPGLVDLQVNGYAGVDFSNPGLSEEDFIRACRGVLNAGTSAFLPTIITSPLETYRSNLPIMAEALELQEFSGRLLGIHLEGPFLSAEPGARGAHNAEWIRKPDVDFLDQLIGQRGDSGRRRTGDCSNRRRHGERRRNLSPRRVHDLQPPLHAAENSAISLRHTCGGGAT